MQDDGGTREHKRNGRTIAKRMMRRREMHRLKFRVCQRFQRWSTRCVSSLPTNGGGTYVALDPAKTPLRTASLLKITTTTTTTFSTVMTSKVSATNQCLQQTRIHVGRLEEHSGQFPERPIRCFNWIRTEKPQKQI